jgi:hypothetical protein
MKMKSRIHYLALVPFVLCCLEIGSFYALSPGSASSGLLAKSVNRNDEGVSPRAEAGGRLFATSFGVGLVEIDPMTGEILAILEPPINISVFDALAYDGTSLFLANGGSDGENIYEIDPDTGDVIAKHPAPISMSVNGMAVIGDNLYLLHSSLNDILVYSLLTDTVVDTLDIDEVNPDNPDRYIGGGLAAMLTGDPVLIATTTSLDYTVIEIDISTGEIVHSFQHPSGNLFGAGDIGVGVLNGEIYVGRNTGSTDQIVVYTRDGTELRRLDVEDSDTVGNNSIGIQSIGADDAGATPAEPSPTLILPQFADGAAAGFTNKTRIALVAGDQPETGHVDFLDVSGGAQAVGVGGKSVSMVPFDIPAGGATEIVTDGTGDLKSGPVEIYSDRGQNSKLKAGEIFDLLGSAVSVPSSTPSEEHRIYVNFDSEERTAFAAYNSNKSHAVDLDLTLFDADGTEVGTASLELAAGAQKAVFLDDASLFQQQVQGDFRGTLTITSQGLPVSILSLIQRRATGALLVVSLD